MRKKVILSVALSIALLSGSTTLAAVPASLPEAEGIEMTVSTPADAAVEAESSAEVVSATETEVGGEDQVSRRERKAANAQEKDSFGGGLTILAMSIVVLALIVLSVLFYLFGKVSSYVQKSRKRKAHGVDKDTAQEHHEELDSGEVIAAISMALAEHMGQGHDIEDTILTIRRMRKAYSPWNSKIYNMRVVPQAVKISRKE
ncbi:MAG: OadG family protein [Lepagella sp.]